MYFNASERIVVLIDGPSLHEAMTLADLTVNFRDLHDFFARRGRVIRVTYYTTGSGQDDWPMRPFVDWLEYNGFSLVLVAPGSHAGERDNDTFVIDYDVRVEVTVDAMALADSVDHVVLMAGHSSYAYLCRALQRQGKRVTIVSTLKGSPPVLSDQLRRQADQWTELSRLDAEMRRDREAEAAGREARARPPNSPGDARPESAAGKGGQAAPRGGDRAGRKQPVGARSSPGRPRRYGNDPA